MYVCMYICNGFMVDMYGTFFLHVPLMVPALA